MSKDKSESAQTTQQETLCTCGSDKLGSLSSSANNCAKHRDLNLPTRVTAAQNQIALR